MGQGTDATIFVKALENSMVVAPTLQENMQDMHAQ